jgi:hypothetical protein
MTANRTSPSADPPNFEPPRGSAKHSAAYGLVDLPDKHRNTDRPRQAPTA